MSDGPYQATPHSDLIAQILDPRIPKNEREHAAAREIERLRADAERFEYVIDHHARSDPDMSGQHHWMLMGRGIGRGQTIREAIDAARRKE